MTAFVCKAPWTSIAFQPTGVAPCCIYDLAYVEEFTDSDSLFEKDRTAFLNGDIPAGCDKCVSYEKEGIPSYKQTFDKYQTDFKERNLQEINIKSNNFCNLACRSCGPHFSSKWEEEFGDVITITKDDFILKKFHLLDTSTLKEIGFAGGEPTLTPEHTYVLQKLIERGHTNMRITMSTNLHNLSFKGNNLVELWKKFPNFTLQVSIDGVNDRAANIRSGSNWDIITKNIKILKENKIKFYVNCTTSALNIWFLEETVNCLSNEFGITNIKFYILQDPDIMNCRVIPEEFKPALNEQIDRCIEKGFNLLNFKNYFNAVDESHLWPHFLIYNLMLDVTRKEKFFDSLPIKKQLLEKWIRL